MSAPTKPLESPDIPARLVCPEPGILDDLTLAPMERRAPSPGEVEVQIEAAGLNFRDVMMVLGVYPGLPDEPIAFTGDVAGTIVGVGSGVDGFRIGDEVMGFVPNSFSSYTTTSAHLITHKPDHLSWTEATTIPGVFMTAYYALVELGRLRADERVLIHAATGGVGLAAVQLSQRIGAEIFATAGNPEKRAYLHSIGIQHVMDSRSLTFAEEVMDSTAGRGVDVVLNSLAGDFQIRSLGLLAKFGRFLELGKQDIYANHHLELYPFRNNLTFFAIDLQQAADERPEIICSLYQNLSQLFAEQELQPLPQRIFPLTEIADAFRYMKRTKHIGKVVVTMRESR
ncbi:MAG: zinc-binding dehydrogenase [Chloroflexota bacterium]